MGSESRSWMAAILVDLPVKTLLRFRCVCKSLKELIADSDFLCDYHERRQLDNSYLLFFQTYPRHSVPMISHVCPFIRQAGPGEALQGVAVVGSCFGVLCLASTPYDVCFWNPSTRTYRHLTMPRYPCDDDGGEAEFIRVSFGLGCDQNGIYKLVRLVIAYLPEANEMTEEAIVYSLGTDTWKTIIIPCHFETKGLGEKKGWEFGKSGVFSSDKIVWVMKKDTDDNGQVDFNSLSFDLENDTLSAEGLLLDIDEEEAGFVDFWPINNTICMSRHYVGDSRKVVIWIYILDNWVMLLTVSGLFCRVKPLWYDNPMLNVLLQIDSRLAWYDLGSGRYRYSDLLQDDSMLSDATVYIESPVLLNDVGT